MIVLKLIIDFVTTAVVHAIAIFSPKYENWTQGDRGDVVVIPGYGGKSLFLEKMADTLNKAGFRIHTIPQFDSYEITSKQAETVADYILAHDLTNVTLLGHSKGGVIAKYLIDTKPEINKRVIKIIGIAVPWKGTLICSLPLKNASELKLASEFIRKLNANTSNNFKIVSLHPKVDNRVIPHDCLHLDGAENIEIDEIGHTNVLYSQKTIKVLEDLLNSNQL